MRPWLYALLVGSSKPHHLGICYKCAAEFHGECVLAWKAYLKPIKCRCRRRGCRGKK